MNPCDNCKKKPNCPERCFPKMDYEIRGMTVYINRNYITDFCYDQTDNKTVISLPGTENYYEVVGDQTQKILKGGADNG